MPFVTGLPVISGVVKFFKFDKGNGAIAVAVGEDVFFNTAIPGEGYRTIQPGTLVKFEVIKNKSGLTTRNIQRLNQV